MWLNEKATADDRRLEMNNSAMQPNKPHAPWAQINTVVKFCFVRLQMGTARVDSSRACLFADEKGKNVLNFSTKQWLTADDLQQTGQPHPAYVLCTVFVSALIYGPLNPLFTCLLISGLFIFHSEELLVRSSCCQTDWVALTEGWACQEKRVGNN